MFCVYPLTLVNGEEPLDDFTTFSTKRYDYEAPHCRLTALPCSYAQAGSPHLSSVFLSLFIFALKILGMSPLSASLAVC